MALTRLDKTRIHPMRRRGSRAPSELPHPLDNSHGFILLSGDSQTSGIGPTRSTSALQTWSAVWGTAVALARSSGRRLVTGSCRYRRHRGKRNERSALRRLAGLIGVLTGSPLKLLRHSADAHRTWGMPSRYYRRALDCPGQVISIGSAGLDVILRFAQWW
jgi:hypothetical protein